MSVSPSKRGLAALLLGSLALSALSGCSSLIQPSSPVRQVQAPAAWTQPTQEALSAPAAAATQAGDWWAGWAGPELQALIGSALRANPDLRQASARLAQARALSATAAADRLPTLALAGAARGGRESSADPKADLSRLGLQASWEPDWLGDKGLARLAAERDARTAALARRALEIMLAAEVAEHYGELNALQGREALARQRLTLLADKQKVETLRWEAGQSSRVLIDQARAQQAQAEAELSELLAARDQRRQALALLLGQARLDPLPRFDDPQQASIEQLPALLPLELLERRPDVQREAAALDAAVARVGVARRDLYPRLSLDWSGMSERLATGGAAASPMTVVGYGLSLSLPIWDGGRIRSGIALREAQAEEAMAVYEKALLAALADVETAVTRLGHSRAASRSVQTAAEAAAAAAQRATRLFEAGQIDRAAVLDAQLQALLAQDQRLQARQRHWSAALSARRALAGDA